MKTFGKLSIAISIACASLAVQAADSYTHFESDGNRFEPAFSSAEETPSLLEGVTFYADSEQLREILMQGLEWKAKAEANPRDRKIGDAYFAFSDKVDTKIRSCLEHRYLQSAADHIKVLELIDPQHPSLPWFRTMAKQQLEFINAEEAFNMAISNNNLLVPEGESALDYLNKMSVLNIDPDRVERARLQLERARTSNMHTAR